VNAKYKNNYDTLCKKLTLSDRSILLEWLKQAFPNGRVEGDNYLTLISRGDSSIGLQTVCRSA
jgi:hypothetical protein